MTQPGISTRALSRTRLALLLFVVATSSTIAIQTWWAVAQDKRQTLTSETTNGLVAVRLLEEHASQTLQDAVHTLDRVARAVQTGTASSDPEHIRRLTIGAAGLRAALARMRDSELKIQASNDALQSQLRKGTDKWARAKIWLNS